MRFKGVFDSMVDHGTRRLTSSKHEKNRWNAKDEVPSRKMIISRRNMAVLLSYYDFKNTIILESWLTWTVLWKLVMQPAVAGLHGLLLTFPM